MMREPGRVDFAGEGPRGVGETISSPLLEFEWLLLLLLLLLMWLLLSSMVLPVVEVVDVVVANSYGDWRSACRWSWRWWWWRTPLDGVETLSAALGIGDKGSAAILALGCSAFALFTRFCLQAIREKKAKVYKVISSRDQKTGDSMGL